MRWGISHIGVSLIFLAATSYFVFFLWYPKPFGVNSGVLKIYALLILVQLVLGPALTLFLYKKDKKKLISDLSVVLLLQLAAYTYGMIVIAQGRPAWIVFVIDDFEIVRPADLYLVEGRRMPDEFSPSIARGPSIVAAVYSEDEEVRFKQKQDELILGKSLVLEPETYRTFESQRPRVKEKMRGLDELEKFNSKNAVNAVRKEWPAATSWLPLKGARQDMAVLLDRDAAVVAVADVRPWD
jgi:hypothetical protein